MQHILSYNMIKHAFFFNLFLILTQRVRDNALSIYIIYLLKAGANLSPGLMVLFLEYIVKILGSRIGISVAVDDGENE